MPGSVGMDTVPPQGNAAAALAGKESSVEMVSVSGVPCDTMPETALRFSSILPLASRIS